MFSKVHDRLGTAGLVVAVVALIAALAGTAFAAAGLNGKQKKEVKSIAKRFAGKPGAQGPQGAAGKDGSNGTNGTNGKDGANGKSVVVGTENTGTANCSGRGGVSVEVEGSGSKKFACTGKEGSPWTAGGTLPSSATETGTWAAGKIAAAAEEELIQIPFTIPLEADLAYNGDSDKSQVHYIGVSGEEVEEVAGVPTGFTPSAACPGTAAAPEAEPGNLCIYTGVEESIAQFFNTRIHKSGVGPFVSNQGASKAGAVLAITSSGTNAFAFGTWAVTAE